MLQNSLQMEKILGNLGLHSRSISWSFQNRKHLYTDVKHCVHFLIKSKLPGACMLPYVFKSLAYLHSL